MTLTMFTHDTRGVSNTLGYALTFALIALSVLFIFASGVGTVENVQQSSQADNALRAMDIFTNNIEDVYRWGAPSRGTELKLSGGALSINQEPVTQIRFDVANPNTGSNYNYTTSINDFRYETQAETAGVYDGGLLFRQDNAPGAEPILVESPPFVFSENRTGVTVLETRGAGSIGGSTTALVVVQRQASELIYQNATVEPETPLDVTVTINSTPEKAAAWNMYFQSQGLNAVDADPTDGRVEYTTTTKRVYIRAITLKFVFNK